MPQQASVDLDEIKGSIIEQRALLSSLLVETTTRLEVGPEDAIGFTRNRIALSGGAVSLTSTTCSDTGGESCVSKSAAWDGVHGVVYDEVGHLAAVFADKAEPLSRVVPEMRSDAWFDVMCWFPITESGEVHSQDLVSILSDPKTSLRQDEQSVNGFQCVVVDADKVDGGLISTYWLAKDRGYLPVLFQLHDQQGNVRVERSVTEVMPLVNGAFVPWRGTRVSAAYPGAPNGYAVSFELANNENGAPIISISPTNEDFDLISSLPSGTRIVGLDGQIQLISKSEEAAFDTATTRIASEVAGSGSKSLLTPVERSASFGAKASGLVGLFSACLGAAIFGCAIALFRK